MNIATSQLLRPVITGTDQIVNLDPATLVSNGSNFAAGPSGSSTHVGGGAGQFALNVPGYIGVTFRPTVGGPDYYGWLQIEVRNTGPGKMISWAYEDVSAAPIQVGVVPEPGSLALLGLAGAGLGLMRRRGHRR